jgi:putative endonuclease
MAKTTTSHYPNIGILGEELVAQWLQSTGWNILQRRFRHRLGEIDIIAESLTKQLPTLAFIEVKTRSVGNWDEGGKYAISSKKRQKIWQTAELFLSQYPEKADCICRFDVALIIYRQNLTNQKWTKHHSPLATSIIDGHCLILEEYIISAFAEE